MYLRWQWHNTQTTCKLNILPTRKRIHTSEPVAATLTISLAKLMPPRDVLLCPAFPEACDSTPDSDRIARFPFSSLVFNRIVVLVC